MLLPPPSPPPMVYGDIPPKEPYCMSPSCACSTCAVQVHNAGLQGPFGNNRMCRARSEGHGEADQ